MKNKVIHRKSDKKEGSAKQQKRSEDRNEEGLEHCNFQQTDFISQSHFQRDAECAECKTI